MSDEATESHAKRPKHGHAAAIDHDTPPSEPSSSAPRSSDACTSLQAAHPSPLATALRLARDRQLGEHSRAEQGAWRGDFWFAQLADTQIGMLNSFRGPSVHDNEANDPDWQRELAMVQLAVAYLNEVRPSPRFVIVCGDLIDAWPAESQSSLSAVQSRMHQSQRDLQTAALKAAFASVRADIPLVCVCGNHDVGNRPTPASVADFVRAWGDDYFTFWSGGVKLIGIKCVASACLPCARALAI